MSAYWTEFAATGNPGRGQNDQQIRGLPGVLMENAALFSTARRSGHFHGRSRSNHGEHQGRVNERRGFSDETLRCQIYARTFRHENFVQAEYDTLAGGICRDIDPERVSFFSPSLRAAYGAAATARSRPAGKTVSCPGPGSKGIN